MYKIDFYKKCNLNYQIFTVNAFVQQRCSFDNIILNIITTSITITVFLIK